MVEKVEWKLTGEEKETLIKYARETVENLARGGNAPELPMVKGNLAAPTGVFVTIKKHDDLRGCIGYIDPIKPLMESVIEMAEAAAFRDPRFPPISIDELDSISIEISVLSPLVQVKNIQEVIPGKHGLVVEKGFARGVLLPQVATEQNWDRNTFVEHTCLKAGLQPDAWKDKDTRIYIFSAEIISEEEG